MVKCSFNEWRVYICVLCSHDRHRMLLKMMMMMIWRKKNNNKSIEQEKRNIHSHRWMRQNEIVCVRLPTLFSFLRSPININGTRSVYFFFLFRFSCVRATKLNGIIGTGPMPYSSTSPSFGRMRRPFVVSAHNILAGYSVVFCMYCGNRFRNAKCYEPISTGNHIFFSVCLFISSLLSNDLEWEVHPGQEIVIWYLCVCGDKCCVFLCICTMRVCVCVCERDLQTRSCCRTADANPFSFCSTPSLIALDIIDCILRWWLRFCSIIHLDLLCVCVWNVCVSSFPLMEW